MRHLDLRPLASRPPASRPLQAQRCCRSQRRAAALRYCGSFTRSPHSSGATALGLGEPQVSGCKSVRPAAALLTDRRGGWLGPPERIRSARQQDPRQPSWNPQACLDPWPSQDTRPGGSQHPSQPLTPSQSLWVWCLPRGTLSSIHTDSCHNESLEEGGHCGDARDHLLCGEGRVSGPQHLPAQVLYAEPAGLCSRNHQQRAGLERGLRDPSPTRRHDCRAPGDKIHSPDSNAPPKGRWAFQR